MKAAAFLVIAGGLGCAGIGQPDPERSRVAQRLAGTWNVSLDGGPNAMTTRAASGVMTLLVSRRGAGQYAGSDGATNYGVYDIDFGAWGFAPRGSRPPAVVSAPLGGDSASIAFDSDRPGLQLTMIGAIGGDTIRGTWRLAGHGAGRTGPFMMVRASPRTAVTTPSGG